MKKPSMMGASKYEFNPLQFDKDIAENQERYRIKKLVVENKLNDILYSDSNRIDETWNMIIEVLRNIKVNSHQIK